VGGKRVRVRLSNAFGTAPLRIGAARVALRRTAASIWASSDRRLTFSGNATIVVPAGAVAVSDAVDLDVPGASDVAVSIYLPGATEPATYRETTLQTSYVTGIGNFVNAVDLPDATPTQSTFYLTVVEVQASEPIGTLVAFGDSITQGAGSTLDANHTWPDFLSARLNPNPGRPRMAVINQGVGCGRLLFDFCGPSGAARFDRDVLAATGASAVIVHLGLNDINIPSILPQIRDEGFKQRLAAAVATYQAQVAASARTDSPYGVPYRPDIWGAGWTTQERGVRQYFFHRGWPELAPAESWLSALNFVLGVHPGENNISFVSGVGANSATTAYGTNRADWSYIPGGVISGTALIRPDLPELKDWPFFWQQTEYVMGGGETNFMFLALAADALYGKGAR